MLYTVHEDLLKHFLLKGTINEVTPPISQNGQHAGQGVKTREPCYTAGGNVNW